MTQRKFLSDLLQSNQEAIIIGSLGTISYDLNEIPHPNKILLKGAMGGAMSCGLGYALAKPEKKVIVVIGDGAFLMKMGSIATVKKYAPDNLTIYVLNNGMHRSTGGQKTNFKYLDDLRIYNPKNIEIIDLDEIYN